MGCDSACPPLLPASRAAAWQSEAAFHVRNREGEKQRGKPPKSPWLQKRTAGRMQLKKAFKEKK